MPGKKTIPGAAALVHLGVAELAANDHSFIVQELSTPGWPDGTGGPFVVCFNRAGANEEKILCSSRNNLTFTISSTPEGRGYDGTTAAVHSVGEPIIIIFDADTVQEANLHVNDDTRDDHSQYLTNARHDLTARHNVGTVVPAGASGDIAASAPGNTAAAGASGKAADAAHRHAREAWGASGDLTTSSPGDTAAAGSSGKTADAAHKHAREAAASVVFPTGMIAPAAGPTAPTGWALCDGSEQNRSGGNYATLFGTIGTTYGPGNGTTTFNLPDGRGRALIGAGAGTGLTSRALGARGGEENHTLTTNELAAHPHAIVDPGHGHGVNDAVHHHGPAGGDSFMKTSSTSANGETGTAVAQQLDPVSYTDDRATGISIQGGSTGISATQNGGGGQAHNNMQPWLAVNWIIKL